MKKHVVVATPADRWLRFAVPAGLDFAFYDQSLLTMGRKRLPYFLIPYQPRDWSTISFGSEELALWISSNRRCFGLFLMTERYGELRAARFVREAFVAWGTYRDEQTGFDDERSSRSPIVRDNSGPQRLNKARPGTKCDPDAVVRVFRWDPGRAEDARWCEDTIKAIAGALDLPASRVPA
jgi:hypothetical protein